MSKLFIMVGIPGSGKSTYAKKLKDETPNTVIVSRDKIRFNLVKENEEYFSKENEVFRTFINQIDNNILADNNVIADATHINPKSRRKLLFSLKNLRLVDEIHAIVMDTPLNKCLSNNENRKGTRSYVPRNIICNMYNNFIEPNLEECGGLIDTFTYIREV